MINFERAIAVLFAACLVLLPLPGAGKAGCRAVVRHGHHVQQQAAVLFQPAYPAYYYQVGQNLQLRAMVQQELQALLAQPQQPQQLSLPPCPDGTCQTPQSLPLTAEMPLPVTSGKCVSCHSGTNVDATAALNLSSLATLDCESKLRMIREAVTGRMPKGKPLSAQELGDFIGEMSGEP